MVCKLDRTEIVFRGYVAFAVHEDGYVRSLVSVVRTGLGRYVSICEFCMSAGCVSISESLSSLVDKVVHEFRLLASRNELRDLLKFHGVEVLSFSDSESAR